MELKKSPKADLENKRSTFLLIGLVVALGMVLISFEWKTKPNQSASLGTLMITDIEEEIIPVTREEEIKPPPPPPPPKVIDVINIVDDDVEIIDELEIADSEADDETIIDISPVLLVEEEEEEDVNKVFLFVEQQPEFPGGNKALYSYINNTVRYPVIAQENGIQGKVYVKFVVDENGDVSNAEILRGVDPSLNKEALRVITSLPKFRPGRQGGRHVKVFYNSVINFTLQ